MSSLRINSEWSLYNELDKVAVILEGLFFEDSVSVVVSRSISSKSRESIPTTMVLFCCPWVSKSQRRVMRIATRVTNLRFQFMTPVVSVVVFVRVPRAWKERALMRAHARSGKEEKCCRPFRTSRLWMWWKDLDASYWVLRSSCAIPPRVVGGLLLG